MSSLDVSSDRILVLGDEAKSARAIERLLHSGGYRTSVASSFESARAQVESGATSLVIADLAASRITGPLAQPSDGDSGDSLRRQLWAIEALDFCKAVRANADTAEVPILFVSKSQRAQDKVASLNAGATDYVIKPCPKGELLSRVKVHLRSWRYEREITDRFAELNLLHAVSSVLASSLDPEILLRGTLTVLIQRLAADAGAVYLQNPDTLVMNLVAAEGLNGDVDSEKGLLGFYEKAAPMLNGKPLRLGPYSELVKAGLAQVVPRGVTGLVCSPLGLKGKTTGAICVFSKKPAPMLGRLQDLLSTVCNQLSIALENARLYVETRKSAAQLSYLYNLGNNLMTSLEMDELLGYAVFTVGRSLESDVCAVLVRTSSDSNSLASGVYTRVQSDKRGPTPEWCQLDRVFEYIDGDRVTAQMGIELRTSDRFLRDPNVVAETIVPLIFDDAVLGLMICANYAPRAFSEDEYKLLGAVAQQLSLAIRNTKLFQRSKDTSINLAVEVSRRTQEIEEQKRFTEKIIDSLPVSLYVVDRDMRIVAWNRNREVGGGGISRSQVLGRSVFNVFGRHPRRKLEDEFLDVFRTGDLVRMEQESLVDGQKKIWRISKIPMRVDNAEVTHVITVGEDITEQKKMNDAVIHAEKLASIGRLAAGVVHELNNPLATIAACAEALTARLTDIDNKELNVDFAEYLQIVREEAFRCKTITNSLLDFSHQRQAEKMSGDINQIIDQTLQLIKHHPKLGKMNVVKQLEPSLLPVYVNEGQMKQIFIALISNAFDAMDGNGDGTLTITTGWAGSGDLREICAEFTDTGCGIPASYLQKIFDPFFTTKPLGRGTGLGLSVCYGIVSEHGGKIEVDSTEGQGSTFRVLLPVSAGNTLEITL